MASQTKNTTSMTEGTIWKSIVAFAIPLFLGNLFQQLYNMADSLIVGNFLGSNALAAVSSSGNLIFLLVGFFNGIAVGIYRKPLVYRAWKIRQHSWLHWRAPCIPFH